MKSVSPPQEKKKTTKALLIMLLLEGEEYHSTKIMEALQSSRAGPRPRPRAHNKIKKFLLKKTSFLFVKYLKFCKNITLFK